MDATLIAWIAAAVLAVLLLWWFARRRPAPREFLAEDDRLDTLIGWPPEVTRVLRTSERLAYSTLKLALPGYIILAQVPVARFITVPKRNSYAEWLRRVGSQCVDFVVCDVTSQVVAVVDVRTAEAQSSVRLKRRLDRLARTLGAVGIPLHVWSEDALPSVEVARTSLLPNGPVMPAAVAAQHATAGSAALKDARSPFEDTDRDLSRVEVIEVIEMPEPSASTWFDDLDSESSKLPPREPRQER